MGVSEPTKPATSPRKWRALTLAPLGTLTLLIVPVLAGLVFTLLPAFGYLPALGGTHLSLAPFQDLFRAPGIGASIRLSITTGFAATALSLLITVLVVAGWYGTRAFRYLERALSPLLSVPHAAAAFGLAFLIAPSGWVARLFSPWATGWETPPDLLIVQDPWGFALILGLVTKEVPFLLLMSLAALPQTRAEHRLTVARSLGYRRITAWVKVILPALYRQIRLPIYAVLAFSLSVVDMAMILGPTTPPPLAVQTLKWMSSPDLSLRFQAASAASLQFLLVLTSLCAWRLGEYCVSRLGKTWAQNGRRGSRLAEWVAGSIGLILGVASALGVMLGLVVLVLWSVAGLWAFPAALPDTISFAAWARHLPNLLPVLSNTILIGLGTSILALTLTIACLEAEHRFGLTPGTRSLILLYLPLLVPQIAFLLGLQTLAIYSSGGDTMPAVIMTHLIFVLPYTFLSLADPWRSWETRYAIIAQALGASANRTLFYIRLPMLLGPILTGLAVGFAISVGQYLPTLLIGGGRVTTLTTEAVALASGADRRLIGITALLQTAVVILPFLLALILPRLTFRHRKGVLHG